MADSPARRPHIVIDARMIADGGIGTYLRNVIPGVIAARPAWRFTLLGDPEKLRSLASHDVTLQRCAARIYSVREQIELPLRTPQNADLFWSPHYNIPIFLTGPRLVVTIHDVAHLALPEITGGFVRRAYARRMHRAVQRRAAAILFVSEFSRGEMNRLVGTPRGDAMVAHHGIDPSWATAGTRSPRPVSDPYLVYVGNFKRHKNLPLLLRAFGRIRDRIPHRLVLIGRREGLRADPAVPRALLDASDRVQVTGEIASDDVQRYVAHADALVTASLYEGFGLPPLEAMAAGVPCVVSNAAAFPEICGDAALYCDPRDEASVATRLLEVATDVRVRRELIAKGRARAAQFSWPRCAADTARVLESVLARAFSRDHPTALEHGVGSTVV